MNITVLMTCLILGSFALAGSEKSDSILEPDTMWTYKQIDGKDLQMSVFLPADYCEEGPFPTIVFFHGGSWNAGEASWHYPDCTYWSKRGMIAVSVDYRLKDRDGVEVPLECVKDAKSSILFLRKNAKKLRVDANKLVVSGGSAGGQLAAALATIKSPETNDNSYDGSISFIPDAVVLQNPYFKCSPELSPPNYITEGLPPFITFLGEEDPAITVAEMRAFHNAIKQAGNTSELYIGKGGKHGFCNGRNSNNPFFYWSLELVDQFLVKHGILAGKSILERPASVKQLQTDDYDAYR